MDQNFPSRNSTPRRKSPVSAMLGLALGSFAIGGVAVWALLGTPGLPVEIKQVMSTEQGVSPVAVPTPAAAPTAVAAAARQAVQQVAQVAEQQGGIDERVAAMEQRLTRLDLQAQAASGNAARAEGLLIAFAARRAIERGTPLGYLENQLRLRFGDARPNAVVAVLLAAQDPVTLDQLMTRLSALAPNLEAKPSSEGTLRWLSREVSQMFVVRRADAPSPAAVNRIERARLFLQTGRAKSAAAEIRQLPNAAAARDWIEDAERYAAAEQALDLLETTAILDTRELRDNAGARVEQASPIG